MPYFYSSNLFKHSEFKDGIGFSTKADEWGIGLVVPTSGSSTTEKSGRSAEIIASLNYSIPLGRRSKSEKQKQDGVWTTKLIRESLYKPVQRENRIIKKAIKLGVTVVDVYA